MTLSPYQEMARRYRALEADLNSTMQVLRRTMAELEEAKQRIDYLRAECAGLRGRLRFIHDMSA